MAIWRCGCCAGGSFFAHALQSNAGGASGSPATPHSAGPLDRAQLEELALASRILAQRGVFDAFGHISMRHPNAGDRYLMARSIAPALVTADDILELDLESNPCDLQGRSVFLERFIHGQIYRARPDVMAIVHSHSPSVIPFGLTQTPMLAMYHNAAFIAAGVPVFNIADEFGKTDMLVGNNPKGIALAKVLADKSVVLMRAHGSVAVGPTLKSAVFRAVMTENNARLQLQATTLGGPIAALDAEEGALADAVNMKTVDRPWQLWTQQAGSV